MTINAADLMQLVILPTLGYLGVESEAASKLLLGTAAQESKLDPFCNCGQGIGIYQITSQQHRAAWDEYLAFRPDLASSVRGLASQHQFLKNPDQELLLNLAYSTAIAWIIYLQADCQLPEADDIDALSECWENSFCHHQYETGHSQDFVNCVQSCCAAA